METQIWIIVQIIIDIIMVALLLWFMKKHKNRPIPEFNYEAALSKSEAILSEMKLISRELEKNLEQKKELSGRILGQLDDGLRRAEDRYRQVERVIRESNKTVMHESSTLKDYSHTRASINALLKKGFTREEIARHLDISVAEIELLLKLGSRR